MSSAVLKNVAVPGLKNGMDYQQLGDSDLVVSKVCMGTMTFGQQNTIDEGVEQLNRAFDHYGINFIDTAEMYPVPIKAETQGLTDRTISKFLQGRKREDVILATKVTGSSPNINWMPRRQPGTTTSLTKEQIFDSVDASLKRLGTDYIDLLQLHWAGKFIFHSKIYSQHYSIEQLIYVELAVQDRYTGGIFGGPDFSPIQYEKSPTPVPFEEQLEALQEVIKAGKVRYVGVSNETPFGVSTFVNLAKSYPDLYPKIVSIQNCYSLLVRKHYEAGVAETCYHHNVGLLAYSPLGSGVLSGKYRDPENIPKGSRLEIFPMFLNRYRQDLSLKAVNAYCDIAEQKAGLTPTQLALSWCYHNELVTSSIIGATSMEQLEENLKSYDIYLDDDIQKEITKVYVEYTDPTKVYKRI